MTRPSVGSSDTSALSSLALPEPVPPDISTLRPPPSTAAVSSTTARRRQRPLRGQLVDGEGPAAEAVDRDAAARRHGRAAHHHARAVGEARVDDRIGSPCWSPNRGDERIPALRDTVAGVAPEPASPPRPLRLTQARIGDQLHDCNGGLVEVVNAFTAFSGAGQPVRAVDYHVVGRPARCFRMLSTDADDVARWRRAL